MEIAASKLDLAKQMLELLDQNHATNQRTRDRILRQVVTAIDQMSRSSIEFEVVSPSSDDEPGPSLIRR